MNELFMKSEHLTKDFDVIALWIGCLLPVKLRTTACPRKIQYISSPFCIKKDFFYCVTHYENTQWRLTIEIARNIFLRSYHKLSILLKSNSAFILNGTCIGGPAWWVKRCPSLSSPIESEGGIKNKLYNRQSFNRCA